MNPLTNTKNIQKLSERELRTFSKSSWHDQYRGSAWVFIGGLPYDLSEGDVIAVFSQYGEVVNINLVRDKDTGKSKGFCFLCYEDQRSTILAVDNFNAIKLLGRTIRVDHVNDYKMPKDGKKTDAETKRLHEEGCAPKAAPMPPPPPPREAKPFKLQPQDLRETLVDQIASDIKLPRRLPIYTVKDENSSVMTEMPILEDVEVKKEDENIEKKEKKAKKEKKSKKKKHKRKKSRSSDDFSSSEDDRTKHKKNRVDKEEKHKKYK